MSNPILSNLEKQETRTPAGYPGMPGYKVGNNQPYGSTQSYSQTSTSTWDQQTMEERFQASAADVVDRGQMTFDDVLVRTGMCFGLLVAAAAVGWYFVMTNPPVGMMLMAVGFIGALVLVMVNAFMRTIRPGLILGYAVLEGLALGAFSGIMEMSYPGIVIQAVLATAAVFAVTLALFASGKVRNSSKLARFTLIAIFGILAYRLLNLGLVWFGVMSNGGLNDIRFFGVPLGILVGVGAVLIGAMCLIQDFDLIKRGVANGVPVKFAWTCAFGLMVTVVWMYLEILQLLARLRD